MSDTTTVACLGAGALGSAMAARLSETGHEVRLWNRTEARARAAAEGAPASRRCAPRGRGLRRVRRSHRAP